jgi:hypothetical protein
METYQHYQNFLSPRTLCSTIMVVMVILIVLYQSLRAFSKC